LVIQKHKAFNEERIMSQPTNFGFGEEEQMLRDAAKKVFKDNVTIHKLHASNAANPDPERAPKCIWNKDLWKQMVDLGWTGVAIPESAGGIGMPAVAVAALAEEAGRVALPSPLITTINSSYVLAACQTDASNKACEKIMEGAAATLAINNAQGSWDHAHTDVNASGDTLNGTAYFVQDAQKADFFIVKAKDSAGIGLYLIDADASGVSIEADAIVDLTRDQARISFKNAKAELIVAEPGNGEAALEKAEPAILTIVAADMVGAAEWQLQTSVEYANTRTQFDHPIGFFQAVKHPLVDLMVGLDQAKSLVYNAACAFDHEPEKAAKFARMANAAATDTADYGSSRSVQYHGGIGFTWECFVHIFFKRQKHNQALFGDATYQRAKLADILMGPIGSST